MNLFRNSDQHLEFVWLPFYFHVFLFFFLISSSIQIKVAVIKGGWFFFFGYHICPPSFLSGGWFYGFFFPRDFGLEKKKPSTKLDLNPKVEKNPQVFEIHLRHIASRFFFSRPDPGGKKNRKIISFLPISSDDRQFCMW